MSDNELFVPQEYDMDNMTWSEVGVIINDNWKKLNEHDRHQRERGIFVGRYIAEPVADGRAIYQIIRENKRSFRVRIIPFMTGDDYIVSYWGEEATVDKEYIRGSLMWRDRWGIWDDR